MSDVLAVDVAIVPSDDLRRRLTAINRTLAPPPVGFHFDDTHVPHLTLAQQFVGASALDEIELAITEVAGDQPAIELTTTLLSTGGTTVTLGVALTPVLTALHRQLMDLLLPFDGIDGDVAAFASEEPPPRQADVAWVRMFRHRSAYDRFTPHVTLGVGKVEALVGPERFCCTEVALFHLGRFCTCRTRLASWTLTARGR